MDDSAEYVERKDGSTEVWYPAKDDGLDGADGGMDFDEAHSWATRFLRQS